jgi:hypothetical protein
MITQARLRELFDYRNKWAAYIWVNRRKINLGYGEDLLSAVKIRHEAEVRLNWPSCNSTSSAYLCLREAGEI